jgi:gluconokinase
MTQPADQATGEAQDTSSQAPFVLSIDVGTSSTRTILFDSAGRAVPGAISQHTYKLSTSEPGEVSVDADMLLDVVSQTIDEALKAAGEHAGQIKAVAMDTFWHGLLGIDASGRPVTPVITWEDTRAQATALELRTRLNEREVHARTGARFHASYWPAKLCWLAASQPDTFKKAAQWISFGEYLHRRLLGKSWCSLSMASGTGLLERRARQWDKALLKELNIREDQLPRLGDIHDSIQGLTSDYAKRWPALRDVPWYPAIGDGAAACAGSGCVSEKHWALTVGTSSAIRVVVANDSLELPDGLWLYLIDGKRAVLGGALSEGGNLLSWMSNTVQVPALKDAEPDVAKLEPDAHGLTILPFISGERSLGWHGNVRMTVTGISMNTTPQQLLRAAMESLAYELNGVYEQLLSVLRLDSSTIKLYASGGALFASALLRSIIADTLDTPVYPSHDQEASARGAALLALEVLGIIPDIAQAPVHLGAPTMPDSTRGNRYRKAARRQRELYDLLVKDQG